MHHRLKEERLRLGLNQEVMATNGGVKRRAQINYESGDRCPDGHYFSAIAAAGADVQYILTGVRALKPTDPVEKEGGGNLPHVIDFPPPVTERNEYDDGSTQVSYSAEQTLAEEHAEYSELRPDQAALLDNVEHCTQEVQDAIKRLAFVSAKADRDKAKSGNDK